MDTIYHYDPRFRFLLGYTNEQRQEGVGIPAHSTLIPPPQFSEGKIPVFSVEMIRGRLLRIRFGAQKSQYNLAFKLKPVTLVLPSK